VRVVRKYTFDHVRVDELTDVRLVSLIRAIRPLYTWFAEGATDEKIAGHIRCHSEAVLDIVTDGVGDCAAFAISYTELFEKKLVLYRDGTVVRDRSCGLYRELVARSIERTNPDYLCAMTQNPRVYELLQSVAVNGEIYPMSGLDVPSSIQHIARHFCSASTLSQVTLIFRDFYQRIRKEGSFKSGRRSSSERLFEHLG
jgi:hypothetical protein